MTVTRDHFLATAAECLNDGRDTIGDATPALLICLYGADDTFRIMYLYGMSIPEIPGPDSPHADIPLAGDTDADGSGDGAGELMAVLSAGYATARDGFLAARITDASQEDATTYAVYAVALRMDLPLREVAGAAGDGPGRGLVEPTRILFACSPAEDVVLWTQKSDPRINVTERTEDHPGAAPVQRLAAAVRQIRDILTS